MTDEEYMQLAVEEAERAAALDEVPVGCVVVRRGEIIARAHNTRETGKCALGHAELNAIRDACRTAGGWRLNDTTLYVTLEPCPMCAGAILNARIDRVVIGARDPRAGAFGSLCDLNALPLNHKTEITDGVLADKSADLLSSFFKRKRDKQPDKGDAAE
ncbi:MAG: nucleoside deaminase [Clostridia bacterium]|nr:nucleoside deaminase [Clostridia bacterium]